MKLKIKQGKKSIFKLPKILRKRNVFKWRITITPQMLLVNDSCDSGWSKFIGLYFTWIHWNSYRFVFRNINGQFKLGYYAYQDFTSPQQNQILKGEFAEIGEIKVGTVLELQISFNALIALTVRNITTGKSETAAFANKKGFAWPLFLARPNLKCPAVVDTGFNFWTP